jgi:hypothetical protein
MTPITMEPYSALDLLLRSKNICNPYKYIETTRFKTASLATCLASATISLSRVTDWFYMEEEKKRRNRRNKLILLQPLHAPLDL